METYFEIIPATDPNSLVVEPLQDSVRVSRESLKNLWSLCGISGVSAESLWSLYGVSAESMWSVCRVFVEPV